MRIKEIADRLGLSPRAIRFYEDKGLIRPNKPDGNGYREFDERHIWRLQTIIALREAGMAIADVKKALDGMDGHDSPELPYYLELQRSVLFAKWVELRQIIETTDGMIELVRKNRELPLADIYRLAEGSRRRREQRSSWRDRWDFDRLAGRHDERVLTDTASYKDYESALRLTADFVAPAAGEQGLDIGTGTGNLAGRLMERGAAMAGVDQSKEMLKRCRAKFPALETKLGNFLALPFLNGRFDFVVSSFAFRHLTDDQKLLALDEMRRVLKPQGRICIADFMLAPDREGDAIPPNGEWYASLAFLLEAFERLGYRTRHRRINELLHVVLAEPDRA